MGFLGSWEDILAVKFFEGFPKSQGLHFIESILVAFHARLYLRFESIS